MSKRLGIIANIGKPRVAKVLTELTDWLAERSIEFVLSSDLKSLLKRDSKFSYLAPAKLASRCDFVLSLGGDGTFLRTACLVAPWDVPIVGVNMGRFGYLAEVSADQLYGRIQDILDGNYKVQNRVMLECRIGGEDTEKTFVGLNDVVIDKGGFPRTIRLETNIDLEYLNTFAADGLIVATPTGSTGYSLSVGGPIIEPDVNALIVNPISPHMLANRPLVVDGFSTIEVKVESEAGDFQVTVDGQRVARPANGTKVVVRRAHHEARIVFFGKHSFYSLLRNKLSWRQQSGGLDK